MHGRAPARSRPVTASGDLPGETDEHVHHQAGHGRPGPRLAVKVPGWGMMRAAVS